MKLINIWLIKTEVSKNVSFFWQEWTQAAPAERTWIPDIIRYQLLVSYKTIKSIRQYKILTFADRACQVQQKGATWKLSNWHQSGPTTGLVIMTFSGTSISSVQHSSIWIAFLVVLKLVCPLLTYWTQSFKHISER